MFDRDKYDELYVHELMTPAPEFIYFTDTMEKVMQKFDQSGAWNLPVVSEDSKYIGFVSKSKLFSAYRKLLRDFYEEGD
jgi:CIC family chloride channel protein